MPNNALVLPLTLFVLFAGTPYGLGKMEAISTLSRRSPFPQSPRDDKE
jgi:hypothetical protein